MIPPLKAQKSMELRKTWENVTNYGVYVATHK